MKIYNFKLIQFETQMNEYIQELTNNCFMIRRNFISHQIFYTELLDAFVGMIDRQLFQ